MDHTQSRADIDSPVGPLHLRADQDGNLTTILFTLPSDPTPAITPASQIPPTLVAAVTQLEEYFTGRRRTFDLPVALHGSAFQQAAWQALTRIPYGATCSYSAQAALMGNPRAIRAVGGANHRNPLPIVVPCHRVIGADGSLTGFGGGISTKQWLLAHERDSLASDLPAEARPPQQQQLFPLQR